MKTQSPANRAMLEGMKGGLIVSCQVQPDDPIYTPDGITLVPISKISVGFGGGGAEFGGKNASGTRNYGGGNGTGVKIEPIGFLVIKDGHIRMINVTPPASNTVDRLIDLVPQVMDRVDSFIAKQKEGK